MMSGKSNELKLFRYKIGFRVYPDLISETFPDYLKYYQDFKRTSNDSDLDFVGDMPNMDEYILSNSNKIQM